MVVTAGETARELTTSTKPTAGLMDARSALVIAQASTEDSPRRIVSGIATRLPLGP